MPVMPDIEADAARALAAAGRELGHLFRPHRAPSFTPRDQLSQTPAQQPVNLAAATAAAATPGGTMGIAQLEDDVKADLTDGLNWLDGFVTRVRAAAPGIIATSEAVGGSTVGKLLEIAAGKILPPGVEEEFLALAGRYFGSFGQVAASAQPQQPAAPAQ
ncbi:MAG: hypothetical protein ACRDSS_15035 [Actinocrinis sp.]